MRRRIHRIKLGADWRTVTPIHNDDFGPGPFYVWQVGDLFAGINKAAWDRRVSEGRAVIISEQDEDDLATVLDEIAHLASTDPAQYGFDL